MEALIAEVLDPGADRGSTLRRLVATLARHDAVEIEVLYPVLRAHVEGGDDLADDTEVRAHVRHEEEVVFPAIRAALPPAEWVELGEDIEAARQDASTHPHPHLGHSRVARAAAKAIDRGREQTINR